MAEWHRRRCPRLLAAAAGVLMVLMASALWPARASAASVPVRPGDTLSALAARYGTSVGALARANGISDPNVILAGTLLTLPPGAQATGPAVPPAGPQAAGPQAAPGAASAAHWLPPQARTDPARLAVLALLERSASSYGVPAALLEALTWWESGWQPTVLSATGAIGIGQLEPSTVAFVEQVLLKGVRLDPYSPAGNVEMTAAFVHYLLQATGGNVQATLAAYQEGLGAERAGAMYPGVARYVGGIIVLSRRFG